MCNNPKLYYGGFCNSGQHFHCSKMAAGRAQSSAPHSLLELSVAVRAGRVVEKVGRGWNGANTLTNTMMAWHYPLAGHPQRAIDLQNYTVHQKKHSSHQQRQLCVKFSLFPFETCTTTNPAFWQHVALQFLVPTNGNQLCEGGSRRNTQQNDVRTQDNLYYMSWRGG